MEDKDKAIEVIKAAMEKEKEMQNNSKESMDENINTTDTETDQQVMDDKDQVDIEEASDEAVVENDSETSASMEEEETINDTQTKEQDASEGKQQKSGMQFFKNSKAKELAAKDQKIEELTDRLMRTMAEFENFRKRSEKEKGQMFDIGVKSVIEKLLPIIDNFERGLGAISETEKESAFAKGIEMIYKQLLTALDEIGVKPIDAVGKEFDPNLHNAVMHGEDESLGANIVSDEFQKGYIYRDLVIRHSMVKVVN